MKLSLTIIGLLCWLLNSEANAWTEADAQKVIAIQQAQIMELQSSFKGLIGQFIRQCPTGWLPADGQGGRVDLRGVFLRGINDFGSGARSDGYADKEDRTAGSTQGESFKSHGHALGQGGSHSHTVGAAGLHTHGEDSSGAHSHSVQGSPYTHSAYGGVNKLGMWTSSGSVSTSQSGGHTHAIQNAGSHDHTLSENGNHGHTIDNTGGTETRPNNVGVIFCVKL